MRSEFQGTGAVFRFTLAQYLKSKSNIATMLLMIVLVAGGLFLAAWSMSSAQDVSTVQRVSLVNRTGVPLSVSEIAAADASLANLIEAAPDQAQATITIEQRGGAYLVEAAGEELPSDEIRTLENAALAAFETARRGDLGYSGRGMSVYDYDESLKKTEEGPGFEGRFLVGYGYAIIVMILAMLSTSYIVRSVVEEKASKLVETLMVSVKPLALILGKILASMCLVVIQMLVLILCGAGSVLAAKAVLGETALTAMLDGFGLLSILDKLDGLSLYAAMFSILLGFLTFALIGALSGCCVDKMEDMGSANSVVMLLAMAGYLIGTTVSSAQGSAAVVFSVLPLVSVFVAPAKYLMGDIGMGTLALSWLVQLLVIALLALLSKKVYTSLLMRSGRVRFKALLRMARKGGAAQ